MQLSQQQQKVRELNGSLKTWLGLPVFCLVLAWGATACSQSKPINAKQFAGSQGVSTDASDINTAEDQDLSTGNDAAPQSLEDIIKQCGVTTDQLKDPDTVLLKKTMKSWPKVFVGTKSEPIIGNVNYKVVVTTKLTIKALVGKTTTTTDFDITATPSQAMGEAQKQVDPLRGTSTGIAMTMEERQKLMADSDAWAGIICTIQPVTELTTNKGGTSKKVKFTPALPMSVSPKADPDRYTQEIGESRVFDNIEAEVLSSTDPAFPQGHKKVGKVTITRINPVLTLNIGDQATQQVQTDTAYKVQFEFGGIPETVGLGLMPSEVFYINYADKNIRMVVADTGDATNGKVVFADDFQ